MSGGFPVGEPLNRNDALFITPPQTLLKLLRLSGDGSGEPVVVLSGVCHQDELKPGTSAFL